jgi:hypothetical protein
MSLSASQGESHEFVGLFQKNGFFIKAITRMHGELLILLFLQAHRETEA